MKRHFRLHIFLLLLVSACASRAATDAPATSAVSQPIASLTFTQLPLEQVESTRTPQPTRTPNPTNTPSPLPSATPTFDVSSVISRTPSPPEQCPKIKNVAMPDISKDPDKFINTFSSRKELVLEYLNAGGESGNLIALLRQEWKRPEIFTKNEVVKDLTGDGVPEILIIPSELFIFGCRESQYQILMSRFSEAALFNSTAQQLVGIQDMNLNGVPEIVIAEFGCGGMNTGRCLEVFIYEWDGQQFASLKSDRSTTKENLSILGTEITIKDIDGNGTLEITLTGGVPIPWYEEYFLYYPWRDESDVYMWDGQHFVFFRKELSAPEYRYQAVQDGDRAMLIGELGKALTLYQDAIFSDKLLGWSLAHREYYASLHQYNWDPDYRSTPTPTVPPDDPQEYLHLAAYARYRIMLIHILLGNMTEAKIVYDTLQEKFPSGSRGHEFALMAKAFWDGYQLNSNVASACEKTIAYTKTRSEILTYLGDEHHNLWQDLFYEPEDVCPFK